MSRNQNTALPVPVRSTLPPRSAPAYPNPVLDNAPVEPEGYSGKAQATADRRAALAGYCLADLVRRTLPRE
jgi:hypothetical protein